MFSSPFLTCIVLFFIVEIRCRDPIIKPHSKILWDGASRIGSVVFYQCEEGYRSRSLKNYSVCRDNGQWEDIDLWCEGAHVVTYHLYLKIIAFINQS